MLSAVALVASADDANWKARREALKNRERPIIYNTDGCDMLYYPASEPITPAAFNAIRLTRYPKTKISTVYYCPQSSGFGFFTTRKAGEFNNRQVPIRKEVRNAAGDFAKIGTDALEMAVAFCHTNGLEVFVSVRVNDTHDSYLPPELKQLSSHPLFPPFKEAHPDCLFGARERGKTPPFCAWSAVDFAREEVRAHMRKFVRDLVENYDVDGIEYDFQRHFQLFKSVAWGGTASEAELSLMTAFMVELRTITEEVGKRRGRPILVSIRTQDSLGYNRDAGIDLERWLEKGVADLWSMTSYYRLEDWESSVALARKYGVKCYAVLDESRIERKARRVADKGARCIPGRNTVPFNMARFAAVAAAGFDGVELFNLDDVWAKSGPIVNTDPRQTDGFDKLYFAVDRGTGGYEPGRFVKGGMKYWKLPKVIPSELYRIAAGRPERFRISMGEKPTAKVRATALALVGTKTQLPAVLKINGQAARLTAFSDGLYTFELPAGSWKLGPNEFEFTLEGEGEYLFNDFAVKFKY